MKSFQTRWTPKQIKAVETMLSEGKSYTEIAFEFHSTRNAIIGLIHRKKMQKLKPPKITVPKPAKKPPNYTIDKPNRRGGDHGKKSKHCAPLPVESVTIRKAVPWPSEGICRAIQGEPKNKLGCPNKLVLGFSYCEDHMKAHYVPNKPRV